MKTQSTSFDHFHFSPEMTKALNEMGFTSPTPIQLETIPLLLKKQTDFLGLAATGTGKTAAYGIPLLENIASAKGNESPISSKKEGVKALILCPTRELAKQVSEQMNLLARYKKTKAIAIYGGSDYAGQLRALKDGVSIVVGTPGRIIDHLDRGTLNLNHLEIVVLDEADEMISMGFKTEIETILAKVNQEQKHQTWLFSATMSREVRKIADQFLEAPQQIQINKKEVVSVGIKQCYYAVREDEKATIIERVIDSNPDFYGLIFCQTKSLVIDLTQTLKMNGYAVDCLHGDMEQNARERTMKAFKAKQLNIVVCTDVASRGIDVKDLTHVINYSLPRELDLYVHRIGRTARGGKEGIALSLVTPSHLGLVYRIEKATQSKMTKIPAPLEQDVLKIKIKKSLELLFQNEQKPLVHLPLLKAMLQDDYKEALASLSKEEIIAHWIGSTLKSTKKPQVKIEDSARPQPFGEDRWNKKRPRPTPSSEPGRFPTPNRFNRYQKNKGLGHALPQGRPTPIAGTKPQFVQKAKTLS